MSNKLLLVDCDGIIREPVSGERFIQHPLEQRIVKSADKAIALAEITKGAIA